MHYCSGVWTVELPYWSINPESWNGSPVLEHDDISWSQAVCVRLAVSQKPNPSTQLISLKGEKPHHDWSGAVEVMATQGHTTLAPSSNTSHPLAVDSEYHHGRSHMCSCHFMSSFKNTSLHRCKSEDTTFPEHT